MSEIIAQEQKEENTAIMSDSDKIMTVCYIKFKQQNANYKEIIKTALANIKRFSEEQNIMVKYNYVENAEKHKIFINGEVVETGIDHIYFKLNRKNFDLFKTYQFLFSTSTYKTEAFFIPDNEEQKDKLLKTRNSFIKITEFEGKLLFKSRTTQASHYYLSRKIFDDNKIKYNNKNFKYNYLKNPSVNNKPGVAILKNNT